MNQAQLILALAALLGAASLLLSLRASRLQRARQAQAEAWPVFVDSLVSLLSSGMTLSETLDDSLGRAPEQLPLLDFQLELKTKRIVDALPVLTNSIRLSCVGEFCALVAVSQRFGGRGLAGALRAHAKRARQENALNSSIRIRTNAIVSVAKLGVVAPWIILGLLLTRPETAQAFADSAGIGVLIFGLVACVLAFRLITLIARTPNAVTVYG